MIAVIVVIALLLGLAAFGYTKFISGAREVSVKAVAVQVGKAIQAHSAHHQLPYNKDSYIQETVDEALGADLPAGATAGPMADTTSDDGDPTATIEVTHEGRTAEVVFERDAIGGPGTVAGIGVAGGGPDSGGGGPPGGGGEPQPAPTLAEEVLADTPAAFWQFDETAGTVAADSAPGGANPGAYVGNPTLGDEGLTGPDSRAVTLSGAGQYVNFGATDWAEGLPEITFEATVRTSGKSGWQNILAKGTSSSSRNFSLYANGTTVYGGVNTTTGNHQLTYAGGLTAGAATHLAITYDGAEVRLYINGEVVAVRAATGTIGAGNYDLHVGAASNGLDLFAGTLDDAAIFTYGLDSGRIAAHARASAGELPAAAATALSSQILAANPAAYYRMSSTGTQVWDYSGNRRHGGTTGAPAGTDGLVAGDDAALHFAGNPQNVSVPRGPWAQGGQVSVEFLARADALGGFQNLVVLGNGASDRSWSLYLSDDTLHAGVRTSAGNHSLTYPGIPSGVTFHLALTYDGSAIRLYYNGILVRESAWSGTLHVYGTPLTMGSTGTPKDYFKGSLDEVAIYSTALSSATIRAHADAAFDGAPALVGTATAYAAAVTDDQPQVFYRLNEADGTTIYDHSGNNWHGTYTGTNAGTGPSLVGGSDASHRFTSGHRAVLPLPPALTGTEMTVEVNFRLDQQSSGWENIVAVGSSSTNRTVSVYRSGGNLYTGIRTTSGNHLLNVSGILTAGVDYHVAITYDGATVRTYLNGTELMNTPASGTLYQPGLPFTIGSHASSDHLRGLADDVAIYARALSAERIAAHASAR